MAAVEAGTGRMDNSITRKLSEVRKGYTAFQESDILFAKITPCMENGKIAVAQLLSSGIGFGSTEFHILRTGNGINPHLLYYYLSQESYRQLARVAMTGSAGQLRVPATFLRETSYPLAPLPEQHRIVTAIEQQFTRLDSAVASLQSARERTKQYRASLLKAAVEGELTKDWRAAHPNLEPASELLKRIAAERRERWEVEQIAKGKDSRKVKYEEPTGPDMSGLGNLPEGWCWVRAEQICDFITKGTTPATDKLYNETGDIPFIKVYNLTHNGDLDFTVKPTFVDKHTHMYELARSKIFPGDILMNIVGPPLGKVSIVPNTYMEWNINQAIAVFRSMPSYNKKLLLISLLAERILTWAIKRAKATADQHNLTLEICRDLPLPLPPLVEQEQIISEVEARLSNLAPLEATIEANLKRAEHERQSILREAFAGRLVEQDPGDEPACVLLERIREERMMRENAEEIRRRENKMSMNKQRGKRKRKAPLYDVLVKAGGELTPEELYKNSEAQRKALPVEEQEENFYIELDAEVTANLIEEVKPVDKAEVLLRAIEQDDPCLEENKESKEGDIVIANEMRQAREFPLVNVVELPEGKMRQSRKIPLASVEELSKGKERKLGEGITRLSLWDA